MNSDEPSTMFSEFFRAQAVYDGTGMIKLELPHLVERGVPTTVSVKVNWAMVLANAVAQLYLFADLNSPPLLVTRTLLPDIVPPHFSFEVELEAATHVRAVVRCGDGTALQVKRWVWVVSPLAAPRARVDDHDARRRAAAGSWLPSCECPAGRVVDRRRQVDEDRTKPVRGAGASLPYSR